MITPTTGNLFTAPADALVNPVNCVGVMGKGLALAFKRAFPPMDDAYVAACGSGDSPPAACTSGVTPPRPRVT